MMDPLLHAPEDLLVGRSFDETITLTRQLIDAFGMLLVEWLICSKQPGFYSNESCGLVYLQGEGVCLFNVSGTETIGRLS